VIGPNVLLRGPTRIGKDCRLDGSALITDATIGDRVHVKFGVVITEGGHRRRRTGRAVRATAARDALGPRVHVGDFVETKTPSWLRAPRRCTWRTWGTPRSARTPTSGRDDHVQLRRLSQAPDRDRQARSGRHRFAADRTGVSRRRCVRGDRHDVRQGRSTGALVFNPKPQMERPGWVAVRRARERRAL